MKLLTLSLLFSTALGASIAGAVPSISQVSAGFEASCAIGTGGAVKCFGTNAHGLLGARTGPKSNTPVAIAGLSSGVTEVEVADWGYHACAIKAGALYCWGDNDLGQLGDGTFVDRSVPTLVPGMTAGVTSVGLGSHHTCAVQYGGTYCWGDNQYGQLSLGVLGGSHPSPILVEAVNVISVAASRDSTCSIKHYTTNSPETQLFCWGRNDNGQLGDGTLNNRTTEGPAVLGAGTLATSPSKVDMGLTHACALMPNGVLKCWGSNADGEIGDGTTTQRLTPVNVLTTGYRFPGPVLDFSCGAHATLALHQENYIGGNSWAMYVWGDGAAGQSGLSCTSGPTACDNHIPTYTMSGCVGSIYSISEGGYHSLFSADGCSPSSGAGIMSTGYGTYGQLGASAYTASGPYDDQISWVSAFPNAW